MQTEDFYDSIKLGLVAMVPRLQRFADVLAGGRDAGHGLLRRSLHHMLAQQHRYQRGTSLDVWAFGEIYHQWRQELSGESDPMSLAKIDDVAFGALFDDAETGYRDEPIVNFLVALPPQQRLTQLLVYGEGLEHEDAGRILDVSPEMIAARLIRMSTSLADRLSDRPPAQAAAIVETLYPEGHRATS